MTPRLFGVLMTPALPPSPATILRSPDHLLAAMPFLLGFHPEASLVLVWLRGGTVALTQRVDLPVAHASRLDPGTARAWVGEVLRPASHAQAGTLIAVLVPEEAAGAEPGDWTPLLDELARQAHAAGIAMLDLLVACDDEWWPVDLADPTAAQARVLDPQIAAEVREDFITAGWTHAGSRVDLERDLAPDEASRSAVQAVMHVGPRPGAELESWRDATLARLGAALEEGAGDDPEVLAELVVGLADVRVRDCILWRLVHADELAPAMRLLTRAMVAAPDGHRAPVATVTGVTAWLLGDGVRASMCIDRALADDDDYGLAVLVGTALANGLPPQSWRQSLDQLTFEACRHGADTEA